MNEEEEQKRLQNEILKQYQQQDQDNKKQENLEEYKEKQNQNDHNQHKHKTAVVQSSGIINLSGLGASGTNRQQQNI